MGLRGRVGVRMVLGMVVVLGMVLGGVRGTGRQTLVDLKSYRKLIVKNHNDLRRNVSPGAADMRQIEWDEELAKNAEEWAEYCRYERPPRYMYNTGANLAYQRYHVNRRRSSSIRSNVLQGLRSWSREREHFKYGPDCGMACSYVQMIYSSAYRVGCAMNTCSRLRVGSYMESYSTLFLCFYAPRGKLMASHPYHKGDTCSQCPADTYCSEGLCAEGAGLMASSALASDSAAAAVASLYAPAALAIAADNPHAPEVSVTPSPRQPRRPMSTDKLTDSEAAFLLQVQNMFRAEDGQPELRWDAALKQWSDWIISCESDFPGPPHTFTNFHRTPDHTPIYEVVYEWQKEGRDTNIQMKTACRTPYDHTDCNHYTNMMQPQMTTMACSAKNCKDGSRQLVCIYDNPSRMIRQP